MKEKAKKFNENHSIHRYSLEIGTFLANYVANIYQIEDIKRKIRDLEE